jgi:hypothetical protein
VNTTVAAAETRLASKTWTTVVPAHADDFAASQLKSTTSAGVAGRVAVVPFSKRPRFVTTVTGAFASPATWIVTVLRPSAAATPGAALTDSVFGAGELVAPAQPSARQTAAAAT